MGRAWGTDFVWLGRPSPCPSGGTHNPSSSERPPAFLCGAQPPPPSSCGVLWASRSRQGTQAWSKDRQQAFIRSPGVRLALLAGVDEVRGTVSLEPLVQPSRVSMPAARLTRERLSDDSGGRGSGHRVPRGCRARSRGSGDTSVP